MLAHALRKEAEALRREGIEEPLTNHDPNTKRYELFEEAAVYNRRANEIWPDEEQDD